MRLFFSSTVSFLALIAPFQAFASEVKITDSSSCGRVLSNTTNITVVRALIGELSEELKVSPQYAGLMLMAASTKNLSLEETKKLIVSAYKGTLTINLQKYVHEASFAHVAAAAIIGNITPQAATQVYDKIADSLFLDRFAAESSGVLTLATVITKASAREVISLYNTVYKRGIRHPEIILASATAYIAAAVLIESIKPCSSCYQFVDMRARLLNEAIGSYRVVQSKLVSGDHNAGILALVALVGHTDSQSIVSLYNKKALELEVFASNSSVAPYLVGIDIGFGR